MVTMRATGVGTDADQTEAAPTFSVTAAGAIATMILATDVTGESIATVTETLIEETCCSDGNDGLIATVTETLIEGTSCSDNGNDGSIGTATATLIALTCSSKDGSCNLNATGATASMTVGFGGDSCSRVCLTLPETHP